MANIGTITVPVRLQITTEIDGKLSGRLVPGTPESPAGNTNASLTLVAAAMRGESLAEFSAADVQTRHQYRTHAHNLLQVFQVLPR